MNIQDMSQHLLELYRHGLFPMADSADCEEIYMIEPENRGLIPIQGLHIPRSLMKIIKKQPYDIRIDTDFETVIQSCAQASPGREVSWINHGIQAAFIELHHQGHAHCIEAYDKSGDLVGGLYGLAIGGIFCGESMFSRANNASKIALIHLCARLWKAGFQVLDSQFINDHLKQFGCYEIPAEEYKVILKQHLNATPDFLLSDYPGKERHLLKEYFAERISEQSKV